jgi:hypothetical protein
MAPGPVAFAMWKVERGVENREGEEGAFPGDMSNLDFSGCELKDEKAGNE